MHKLLSIFKSFFQHIYSPNKSKKPSSVLVEFKQKPVKNETAEKEAIQKRQITAQKFHQLKKKVLDELQHCQEKLDVVYKHYSKKINLSEKQEKEYKGLYEDLQQAYSKIDRVAENDESKQTLMMFAKNNLSYKEKISDFMELLRKTEISLYNEQSKPEGYNELKNYFIALQYPPLDGQWDMIFTPLRNAYVVAGAGSGKSTTLIQRVIFMVKILKIPLNEITIFSFTRASVAEFQEKLRAALDEHQIPYDNDLINNTVTTFHRKILRMTGNNPSNIFEFIGKSTEEVMVEADNLQSSKGKHNSNQVEMLSKIFRELYNSDERFKEIVGLLQIYFSQVPGEKSDEKRTIYETHILARDKTFTEYINNEILGIDDMPIKVDFTSGDKMVSIYANKKIVLEGRETFLFYGPTREELSAMNKDKLNLTYVYPANNTQHKTKDMALKNCFADKRVYVSREFDQEFLFCRKEIFTAPEFGQDRGEEFSAPKVRNYLKFKHPLLDEELFSVLSFSSAMAINPKDILEGLEHDLSLVAADRLFLEAACIYIPFFHDFLARHKGYFVFDKLFQKYSVNNKSTLKSIPDRTLKSMRHIMIDEFQDISPLISNWITGMREEVLERSSFIDDRGSLMVVGDDYQSIYGWRGSSPGFLMDYDKHFNHHLPQKIMMNINFRSTQQIIDDAERVLEDISYKIEKNGRAFTDLKSEPLIPVAAENFEDDFLNLCLIQEHVNNRDNPKFNRTLYILARSNKALDQARKLLKSKDMKEKEHYYAYTFHGSKGLQAQDVVLINDCAYFGSDGVRNYLYNLADQEQSYDEAQTDEAKRLAYVAITRAQERVEWVGKKFENGKGVINIFT